MELVSLKSKKGNVTAKIFKEKEYFADDKSTIVLDYIIGSIREENKGYQLYIYEISENDNSLFFVKSIDLEGNEITHEKVLSFLIGEFNEYGWIFGKDEIIDERFNNSFEKKELKKVG